MFYGKFCVSVNILGTHTSLDIGKHFSCQSCFGGTMCTLLLHWARLLIVAPLMICFTFLSLFALIDAYYWIWEPAMLYAKLASRHAWHDETWSAWILSTIAFLMSTLAIVPNVLLDKCMGFKPHLEFKMMEIHIVRVMNLEICH